jgi:hypothetical protein
MVLILAFTAAGLYEVVVGSSGKTAVTGAFAAGPSSGGNAANGPAAIGSPTASARQPGPVLPSTTLPPGCTSQHPAWFYLGYLRYEADFPVRSTFTTNPESVVPAKSAARCSTSVFRDTRGRGIDVMEVFATPADAAEAAGSYGGGDVPMAIGPVMLTLDRSVAALAPEYRSALAQAAASSASV